MDSVDKVTKNKHDVDNVTKQKLQYQKTGEHGLCNENLELIPENKETIPKKGTVLESTESAQCWNQEEVAEDTVENTGASTAEDTQWRKS